MKTLFFEARYNGKMNFSKIKISELPKNIALFTTVQFFDYLNDIKEILKKSGKKVILPKGLHAVYDGQALGCSLIEPIKEKNIDAFLYIGDGMFHPQQIFLKNNLPVFVFNPKTNKFFKIDEIDIERIRKRMKGALLKFLSSKKIGIVVSLKPGQNKLALARRLKLRLKEKRKEAFLFISDTIDFSEFQNFPFVDVFVNTACPRIAYDEYDKFGKPVIDYEELPDEYKK